MTVGIFLEEPKKAGDVFVVQSDASFGVITRLLMGSSSVGNELNFKFPLPSVHLLNDFLLICCETRTLRHRALRGTDLNSRNLYIIKVNTEHQHGRLLPFYGSFSV